MNTLVIQTSNADQSTTEFVGYLLDKNGKPQTGRQTSGLCRQCAGQIKWTGGNKIASLGRFGGVSISDLVGFIRQNISNTKTMVLVYAKV